MKLLLKRVYDPVSSDDGVRVLVDRLWPRGLSKDKAHVDLWLRDLAPSDGLRKWFAHDPKKWPEFRRRYQAELKKQPAAAKELAARVKKEKVTLLFGAKDAEHNNAVALQEWLGKFN